MGLGQKREAVMAAAPDPGREHDEGLVLVEDGPTGPEPRAPGARHPERQAFVQSHRSINERDPPLFSTYMNALHPTLDTSDTRLRDLSNTEPTMPAGLLQ